jgi:hypothetical protein
LNSVSVNQCARFSIERVSFLNIDSILQGEFIQGVFF